MAVAEGSEATYQVRALERGLQVLGAFADGMSQASLQELHQQLGLNKATLLRLLDVLHRAGFVDHDQESGKYRLGVRAFEVGNAYLANLPIEQLAQPYLQELSEQTGQTSNLGVLAGHEVVHVATVVPDRPLRFHTRVGFRDALHWTALGKMLAAHMAPEELRAFLARAPFPGRTPSTITDAPAFLAELKRVRDVGFAEDREESVAGLRCLAAPICDASGRVVAAVSISGLAHEFGDEQHATLVAAVLQSARAISRRLGSTPDRAAPNSATKRPAELATAQKPADQTRT